MSKRKPSAPSPRAAGERNPTGQPDAAELTVRAIAAGVLFGMLFGAANAYLGLRVGMTVSTSIPVAIMTVAVIRVGRARAGLREVNLAQTTGSASTALATGTIFTMPALYLWGQVPSYAQVTLLALLGGILGVAAMVPLRDLLIVRSAGELPYPEGTACAEVLRATERRLPGGAWIFYGLAVGIVVKLALGLGALLPGEIGFALPGLPNAEIGLEITPALIAVGYILGVRQAGVLVSGSLISALVLIPLITVIGAGLSAPVAPAEDVLITDMGPGAIWKHYVRYIGAGAVAAAGILTVIGGLPAIASSFWSVVVGLRAGGAARERVDRDLPGWMVAAGIILVIGTIALIPAATGGQLDLVKRLVCAVAVAVFGIMFVAVMARIAGIVGTSSQPTSGITIVTLLGVGALFAALGWTMDGAKVGVLCVGAVVAIAASCSGDMAQDLKTGRLVGATPVYQQIGQLVGVATSCWVVALTVRFLGDAYTFGSKELPAPQGTLISTLIQGVLDGTLPWSLLFIGAGIAVAVMLAGVSGLAFAIGIYLPLPAMLPIFLGGLVRHVVEWRYPRPKDDSGLVDPGILAASGMVAGEGLAGVVVASMVGLAGFVRPETPVLTGSLGMLAALAVTAALAGILARAGQTRPR